MPEGEQWKDVSVLIEVGVVCNNAGRDNGSATEKALLSFGERNGLSADHLRQAVYNRVGEIPFSSERKYMAVQCQNKTADNSVVYFMKGAASF